MVILPIYVCIYLCINVCVFVYIYTYSKKADPHKKGFA